ncbi:MAG: RNA polymerase sigma factor [Candidatus Azobacteroides sp.]|nr:RNA polymerase sigma factor [Candidatus Azobacteroides sp.]
MKIANDLFYIRRIKAGDIRAFTGIVEKYRRAVLTIVMKIIGNKEDAEDLTQEIFIKVFKSLEQFREESEFSTWLYRIAYNTTLSELRKKKLFFSSIEDHLFIEKEEDVDTVDATEEEKLRYLEQALTKLAPEEMFLIGLYYLEKQSIDHISAITQLSVSNVKVKLYRIRKKLALEINNSIQ